MYLPNVWLGFNSPMRMSAPENRSPDLSMASPSTMSAHWRLPRVTVEPQGTCFTPKHWPWVVPRGRGEDRRPSSCGSRGCVCRCQGACRQSQPRLVLGFKSRALGTSTADYPRCSRVHFEVKAHLHILLPQVNPFLALSVNFVWPPQTPGCPKATHCH